MDSIFLISIVTGIAVVLLFFVAKFALRWLVRFALIGLLLMIVAGAAWWWFTQPKQTVNKPHAIAPRRATADRP